MSDGRDDVLAQPTRARLFALLGSLGRPAGTQELAAELGLHPSGVRVHLERLEAAGLIARERVPQSLGRPRDGWSIAPDSRPVADPPDAYSRLARWLARSTPNTPRRLREIERAGREVGRELIAEPRQAGADEAMGRMLTSLGFAPQRERTEERTVLFRLGHCPYRDAVRENQPVICQLHRGLTLGLLDRLDPGARLTDFVPKDPDRAGCLIELARPRRAGLARATIPNGDTPSRLEPAPTP
jgi:predicted ArsR family transcriptional regulator